MLSLSPSSTRDTFFSHVVVGNMQTHTFHKNARAIMVSWFGLNQEVFIFSVEAVQTFLVCRKAQRFPEPARTSGTLCLKGSIEMNRNRRGGLCFLPVTSIFY